VLPEIEAYGIKLTEVFALHSQPIRGDTF